MGKQVQAVVDRGNRVCKGWEAGPCIICSRNARSSVRPEPREAGSEPSGRILNGTGEPVMVFTPENGMLNLRGSILW